jgi:hypothetical protein
MKSVSKNTQSPNPPPLNKQNKYLTLTVISYRFNIPKYGEESKAVQSGTSVLK